MADMSEQLDVLLRRLEIDKSHHARRANDVMESELTQAVARHLRDGRVIASSYTWHEMREVMPGDLDGLVVGSLPDTQEDVIVVCEARHDMATEWQEAVDQLLGNVNRLTDLWDDDDNQYREKDASNLMVSELQGRKIIVAVGGAAFGEDVRSRVQSRLWRRGLRAGWVQVQLDGESVVNVHMPNLKNGREA